MKADKQYILETVKQVIAESAKIKFAGHQFMLKVDVNEDPNKKGIKVQFVPTRFGTMTRTQQDDIAIELGSALETGLSKYGLRLERDRDLKDKSIVGFFIYHFYSTVGLMRFSRSSMMLEARYLLNSV